MLKSKFYLSLKIIQYLATAEKRVTTDTLAEMTDISVSYTEQLLVGLRQGGIVNGHKGPGGGQKLVDGALTDLRLIDLGKVMYPGDLNADDLLIGKVLDGTVSAAIKVTETVNPSCFGKRLGVKVCTLGCQVADECYGEDAVEVA